MKSDAKKRRKQKQKIDNACFYCPEWNDRYFCLKPFVSVCANGFSLWFFFIFSILIGTKLAVCTYIVDNVMKKKIVLKSSHNNVSTLLLNVGEASLEKHKRMWKPIVLLMLPLSLSWAIFIELLACIANRVI